LTAAGTIHSDPTTSLSGMENAIVAVEEADQDDLVEEELLVEEISIDGMCGVY